MHGRGGWLLLVLSDALIIGRSGKWSVFRFSLSLPLSLRRYALPTFFAHGLPRLCICAVSCWGAAENRWVVRALEVVDGCGWQVQWVWGKILPR